MTPPRSLRKLVALGVALLLACQAAGDEGHEALGANNLFEGNDSIPAGETRTFAWQAVRSSSGAVGVEPLEVRFSASGGHLSVLVDTTASDGIAQVEWTVGGVTGSQWILAEFYYLDGERSFGVGKNSIVVPAKIATLALSPDSVVLFRGEAFRPRDRIIAAHDSFGNERGVGELTLAGTAGMLLSILGDSVRADSAGVGGVIVHADLVSDTIPIRVEGFYLFERPITFAFNCWQSDTALRGTDNALVGYELAVAGEVTGILFPGDSGYYSSLPGLFQLLLTEDRIFSWSDGVVDTIPTQRIQEVTRWRPDSVEYGAPGSSRDNGFGTRSANQIIGGNWCKAQGGSTHQYSPAVLTIH